MSLGKRIHSLPQKKYQNTTSKRILEVAGPAANSRGKRTKMLQGGANGSKRN